MYRQHFALRHWPFENALHVDELFETRAQAEAHSRLRHLLELRGIGLVTGEPGCGKTTVCRSVRDSLHTSRYRARYVSLSTGSVRDTYRTIAAAFGLEVTGGRATVSRAIRAEVTRLVEESRQLPVLILDEAHHLRNEVLEELRLLTNYHMDSANRFCLLLVGLTELRHRLALALYEAFAQRIVVRLQLGGLERDEIGAYLSHRMRLAGAAVEIFAPEAVEAVALASNGMPRRVNRIAHYALLVAAIDKTSTVTADHVNHACDELAP